ncbi:MerR family transcriptional regulator [Nocardia jejuensis]|uniref:MerR family transcriptional regulator n=1 Tax=Nocardia jejuensis TaxID=328049 RepID=UPI000B26CFF8|nr:MerR family transcriptional regulator [Nocardia jejuensis]
MSTVQEMKIGDAAAELGVEAHVLRHWESVGLLHPPRSASGHRSYDQQTLHQARLIQILQRTGLSLNQIRQLGAGACGERQELIDRKRADVREQIALLRATDRFLEHLMACIHPVIAECPECSAFTTRYPARSSWANAMSKR